MGRYDVRLEVVLVEAIWGSDGANGVIVGTLQVPGTGACGLGADGFDTGTEVIFVNSSKIYVSLFKMSSNNIK